MKQHIVAFASVTYANKAKAVLNREGVSAKVIRTPGNVSGGCGYSVVAAAGASFITGVLERNGIPYKSISEVRSQGKA